MAEDEVRMRMDSAHSNWKFTPSASTPFQVRVRGAPEISVVVDSEKSIIGCAEVWTESVRLLAPWL